MKATIKSTRTMGIEVEFKVSRELSITDVVNQLNSRKVLKVLGADNKVEVQGYNHTTAQVWKIVPDSSAQWELVSPILKEKVGINQTRVIIDALANIEGVSIDMSCGVHVHVGTPTATAKQVGNLLKYWAKNELVMDSVIAPSRRNGRWSRHLISRDINSASVKQFCKKVDECVSNNYTIEQLSNTVNGTRYKSINLESFVKYRTVEFRTHGATLCSEKISNWAIMLTSLVDRCFKMRNVSSNMMDEKKAFKQIMGCTAVTERFFRDRANGFGFTQFKNDEITVVSSAMLNAAIKLEKLSNGGFRLQNTTTGEQMNESVKQVTMDILTSNGVVREWNRMNTRAVGNLALSMEGVS